MEDPNNQSSTNSDIVTIAEIADKVDASSNNGWNEKDEAEATGQ